MAVSGTRGLGHPRPLGHATLDINATHARRGIRDEVTPRWPAVVRRLRRTHLFAGLTLCPWVVMYGVTALLFNHPGLAAGPAAGASRSFGHVAAPPMPPPASWAGWLVDSLNAVAPRQGVAYRLVDPDSAAPSGGLQFLMTIGDTLYRMSYDARNGTVTGRTADANSGLGARNFLTALHKTRGYSDVKPKGRPDGRAAQTAWARRGWALAVDAVGLLMLFWACSGLAMWWQIRSLRVIGGLLLSASAAAATVLVIGLHHVLARG
jgi:hypothetical protein